MVPVVFPASGTVWLFCMTALALLVIPGPAVLYVVAQGAEQGRRVGLASVAGIHVGTLVHVAAATVGLSALIVASALAFSFVKYAGAVYLVYLGVRKLLERDRPQEIALTGRSQLYLKGVLVQLLNPKIAIFFVAFLPQFVDSSRGPIAAQILLLGSIFTALAVLSDGAYVLVGGAVGGWIRASRRARGWIAKVSGGVYIGLGLTAALSGSGRSAHS
jgi:threonine/homoserine/homoserine lactone efflux protein